MNKWSVHKFGGTSMKGADRIRHVAKIVSELPKPFVVVSAMGGVTNALLELLHLAENRDASYLKKLREIRALHMETLSELADADAAGALIEKVRSDCDDIEDLLRAVWLSKSAHRTAIDLVSGYGEHWSASILAAHLVSEGHNATFLDAREIIVATDGDVSPTIDWEQSQEHLSGHASLTSDVVIATGFVASFPDGVPRTLGRNGSDFSASIFGKLIDADSITIWTDVDGVLSANPNQVPEARVLEKLSYQEAMELSYFGAKVVHPNTMSPAIASSIPIVIRNTMNVSAPGTIIGSDSNEGVGPVAGFASVADIALVNVEGSNMMGVPGIAQRLFGALRDEGVSVVAISQGSSEHSICFAIPSREGATARTAVERAFFAERAQGFIQAIEIETDCAIVAAVGDAMEGQPGIAAKFFGALGNARINIKAIAQGSSERNISAVIQAADETRALRAVHAAFYLSNQTLSVGVIGPGVVGGTLLEQLREQRQTLSDDFRIDLRVRGIATSSKMLTDSVRVDLDHWRDNLNEPIDLNAFVESVQTESIPHSVIVDCTSDPSIADHYAAWLARGIHIVTPNKKANSAAQESYDQLQFLSRQHHAHYLYETTVGAGLPILKTARDLIQTGDALNSVSGVFSGTLSYLFNRFDGSEPFSQLVSEAKEQGYTEPDRRDDLRRTDVARKLVILAREFRHRIELADVQVESLVPAALDQVALPQFMEQMSAMDDDIAERFRAATEEGQVLRYVGRFDPEHGATVSLQTFETTHPFARIRLTDNIVEFVTTRYATNPLVVQGPGAGPEVTAAGVFADLLRLANFVGAAR